MNCVWICRDFNGLGDRQNFEMSEKSLSRPAVTCNECDAKVSHQGNLKVHYERQHPGKLCRAKGQSVLNFSIAPKRARTDDTDSAEVEQSFEAEIVAACSGTSDQEGSRIRKDGNSTDLLNQMQSLLDALKVQDGQGSSQLRATCPQDVNIDKSDNFDLDVVDRVRVCASLKDIEEILKSSFLVDKINQFAACNACVPNPENQLFRSQQNLPGLFKVEGVEYEKEKIQSRELRHLKEHMISHLKTKNHLLIIANQKEEKRFSR